MPRQITNHRKTNEQKMLYHQDRLEYWQGIIDEAEKEALRLARQQINALPRREDDLEPDPFYVAKGLLKDNFRYQRAVGSRNGHQEAVKVYTALYLAEKA